MITVDNNNNDDNNCVAINCILQQQPEGISTTEKNNKIKYTVTII